MRLLWSVACLAALAGSGCGGDEDGRPPDPPKVEPDDVDMPVDVPAAIVRLDELCNELKGFLDKGEEIHTHRRIADEIAIIGDAVGGLADKGYPPDVAKKMTERGREIGTEGRKLGKALKKNDPKWAGEAHRNITRQVERLRLALPRAAAEED